MSERKVGLSPRTRGKLAGIGCVLLDGGPIPADAGETQIVHVVIINFRAYPRGRGGNVMAFGAQQGVRGLSPRTRGKPLPQEHAFRVAGPIPADAGETSWRWLRWA